MNNKVNTILGLMTAGVLTGCAGNIQSNSMKPGDLKTTNSADTTAMMTAEGWNFKTPAPTAYSASANDNGYDMFGSSPFGGTFVSGKSVSMIDTKNLSGKGLRISYNENGEMTTFELDEFDANASDVIAQNVALVAAIKEYLMLVPDSQKEAALAAIAEQGNFFGKLVSPEVIQAVRLALGGV